MILRLSIFLFDSAPFIDLRLAANWPPEMQIVRLLSLGHVKNKYVLISICILLTYFGISGSHEFCSVALLILYAVTRQYAEKADFLVFRAMNPHGFLAQLKEKKLVGYL